MASLEGAFVNLMHRCGNGNLLQEAVSGKAAGIDGGNTIRAYGGGNGYFRNLLIHIEIQKLIVGVDLVGQFCGTAVGSGFSLYNFIAVPVRILKRNGICLGKGMGGGGTVRFKIKSRVYPGKEIQILPGIVSFKVSIGAFHFNSL